MARGQKYLRSTVLDCKTVAAATAVAAALTSPAASAAATSAQQQLPLIFSVGPVSMVAAAVRRRLKGNDMPHCSMQLLERSFAALTSRLS